MPKMLKVLPAGSVALVACTQEEADGFEQAVDSLFVSFLQFILVMMLIAAVMFVVWAMIFAGAATAVIAGIKRLSDRRAAPPSAPAQADQADQEAAPQPTTSGRSEPDWLAVGMIIFGVVLLLAAAPTVFTINFGPTSAGSATIPLPLILGGAGLVWYALRRRRDSSDAPPARRDDDQRS